MHAADLQLQFKGVSAYEVPHHSSAGKLGAANWRLAYGCTGSAISKLINRSRHVWKCRISAFMLAQSNKALQTIAYAYKASAGRMNSSGKYSRKFDIRDPA
ncbi:hypothetical protein T05_11470 [Trichinella murrelli]|uniref:Uncharacterized protein n=1 Tax=Trichinella murrelli TaxID=144512 RepID=A0A0V0TKT5_9BILA|nr:hypothetical protein T05_11470 [Trichinella murrelli]